MNNSSDFQAQTRNPQSDVNGSLQPNSTNLQPVAGGSQAGSLNPQILPRTNSLQVVDNGRKAGPPEAPIHGGISPWVSPAVAVFLLGLLWFAARRSEKKEQTAKTDRPAAKPSKATTKSNVLKDKVINPALTQSSKKKAKPKNRKRRK